MSRVCNIQANFSDDEQFSQCPGAYSPDLNATYVGNYTTLNYTVVPNGKGTTLIPKNITDFFTKATERTTIASIFDIQWRFYKHTTSDWFDNGQRYLAGTPKVVENLILRENISVVEGLIVDMSSGGIGYRNHTVPLQDDDGAQWQEDILWLTPDIYCANLNSSLLATVGSGYGQGVTSSNAFSDLEFMDDGGIANLPNGNPFKDWPVSNVTNPLVKEYVQRSAFLNNALTAIVLNVTTPKQLNYSTNATIGTTWALPASLLNNTSLGGISLAPLGVNTGLLSSGVDLFGLPYVYYNSTTDELYYFANNMTNTCKDQSTCPFITGAELMRELPSWCIGSLNATLSDIVTNKICGYFREPPFRIDGGDPLEIEEGSKWKIPQHLCGGSIKASIKTVSLSRNGTAGLSSLSVESIRDKEYASAADYPLWAFEDDWYPGSLAAIWAPFWGIVDESDAGTPGYNYSKGPEFYLPSMLNPYTLTTTGPTDSMAAVSAPMSFLDLVLGSAFGQYAAIASQPLSRYKGDDSAALSQKWQEMSKQEDGVQTILRLVWTDLMASATVGTKGRVSLIKTDGSQVPSGMDTAMVVYYKRRITYDLRYGIPAFILLAGWLALWVLSLLVAVLGRHGPKTMNHMLRDTSLGRLAARTVEPDAYRFSRAPTKEWSKNVGHVKVALGHNHGAASPTEKGMTRVHEVAKDGDQSARQQLLNPS